MAVGGQAKAGAAPTQTRLAQQISGLRLTDGFTMTYRVTVRDRRTLPMLAQSGERAPHATEQFSITLSGRDGRLLFLSSRGRQGQIDSKAIVLDGNREYEATGRANAMINADGPRDGTVYRNENVDRLEYCPLPGVGLPGVDLIQSPVLAARTSAGHLLFTGRVPRLNIVGEEPYQPGTIEAVLAQGHLKILSLAVRPQPLLWQTWHFTSFRLFQRQWIGGQMQAALYYGTAKHTAPSFIADYRLVDARPTPLPASAFDIAAYLAKGSNVLDTADGLSFPFDLQTGDLKTQARKATAARRARNAAPSPH